MVDFAAGSAFALAFGGLQSQLVGVAVALDAIFIALAVLIAVEVARGVMKR